MTGEDATATAPAVEEKDQKKVKIIKPYAIPQWFQHKCIKSQQELASINSGLVIKKTTPAANSAEETTSKRTSALFDDAVKVSGSKKEDGASDIDCQTATMTPVSSSASNDGEAGKESQQAELPTYQLEEEVYTSFKHTIAPTVSIGDEGTAFEQPTGIVIKVESVEALCHADAAIVQVAKDLATKLLVLDPEDLEDLAADFHVEHRAAEKIEEEERRVKRAAKKAKDEKKAAKEKAKRVKDKAEEKARKKAADKIAEEKKEAEDKAEKEKLLRRSSRSSPRKLNQSTQAKAESDATDAAVARSTAAKDTLEGQCSGTPQTEAVDADQVEVLQLQAQPATSQVASNETKPADAKATIDLKTEGAGSDKKSIEGGNEDSKADESSSDDESETDPATPEDENNNMDSYYPYYYDVKTSSFPLATRYFDPVGDQVQYKQAKSRGAASLRYLITGQEPEPEDDTVKAKSLATQPPVIVQLRYINRLLKDDAAERIFFGLRTYIKSYRKVGQKAILLLTAVSNEDPFKTDSADDEDTINPWQSTDDKLSNFMNDLEIDGSALFELKTVQKIDTLQPGPADSPMGYKIQRLKRHLRHGYPKAELSWLEPSANWSDMDTEVLTALSREEWTDNEIRQAARQIVGCALAKGNLEFSDVLGGVEQIERSKEIKKKTEEEKKFDEKLDKVRRTCNEYESRLLSCVVKPSTLKSTYDDVIIDAETKDTIKQLISLFRLKTTSKSEKLLKLLNINGAMFYGPPGTGKTHLCRAMATDQNACMLAVDPSSIADMWVGETEKLIKASFTLATKLSPCLLFIDEADALFRKRTPCDKSWERSSLTMFLQQMDGIATDKKRPFVVVATNRPADLDDAFLRRLPHKVLFRLPAEQQRAEILRLFIKDEDLVPGFNFNTLARLTVGFSGSDLKSLCGQAVLAWATENALTQSDIEVDLQLKTSHFTKALQRTRPTVSAQSLREIEEWSKMFNHGR
ncbi:hypothetical protein AMS68_006951 [Peltaster fructicola]|uniref:AAA+ ATPase domain-containing protein n=1 Tax=Peltaster fructicola TaxID=286661 RepID=A0A6H0Y354_9PEZI|nr:hypothetical protein AMS68_006951 [Peltaster fructicola]